MIAIPAPEWETFGTYSLDQMAQWLQQCAAMVKLKRFLKAQRGAKKKRVRYLLLCSCPRGLGTQETSTTHC